MKGNVYSLAAAEDAEPQTFTNTMRIFFGRVSVNVWGACFFLVSNSVRADVVLKAFRGPSGTVRKALKASQLVFGAL